MRGLSEDKLIYIIFPDFIVVLYAIGVKSTAYIYIGTVCGSIVSLDGFGFYITQIYYDVNET